MYKTRRSAFLLSFLGLFLLAGCGSSSSSSEGDDLGGRSSSSEIDDLDGLSSSSEGGDVVEDSDGSDDSVSKGLSVEWVFPEVDMGVGTIEPISVGFNMALAQEELTDESLWVETEAGYRLYGELSLKDDGHTLQLELSEPLDVLSGYEAVVHRDIASKEGGTLDEDYRWSFQTRDLSWSEPELLAPLYTPELDPSTYYSVQARTQLNQQGFGLLAWAESIFLPLSEPRALHVRLHDPDLGWSAPEVISERSDVRHSPRDVIVDESGNALLMWEYRIESPDPDEDPVTRQQYRYYSAENGWDDVGYGPSPEDGPNTGYQTSALALGGGHFVGQARVTNAEGDFERVQLHFEAEQGWTQEEVIPLSGPLANKQYFRRASNGQGDIFYAWSRVRGDDQLGLWVLHYNVDDGWSEPHHIPTSEDGGAPVRELYTPSINASGQALVAWHAPEERSGTNVLWTAFYEPGSGWTAAEQVTPVGSDELDSAGEIALGPNGHAVVLTQGTRSSSTLRARHYEPGHGWHAPEILTRDHHSGFNSLDMEWGSDDTLVLVNRQNTDSISNLRNIVLRRFHPDTGWDNGHFFGRFGQGSSLTAHILPETGPRLMMIWGYGPLEDDQPLQLFSSKGY